MTQRHHPMAVPLACLSTALIAVIGPALVPRTAEARQLSADRDLVIVAGDAVIQLDIEGIVDHALRAASLALQAVDVARVVEQALDDVDLDREISRALEDVRVELRGEDIARMVEEALEDLEDLDIDEIVREATEHAREHARRRRR